MRALAPRMSAHVVVALLVLAPATARADALDDDPTPPTVSITKPAARTELPAGTTKTTIEVKADDDESGVHEVSLLVDGKAVKTLEGQPWVFADIELAAGTHEIVAQALNGFGDEGASDPITIVVAAAVVPVADTKVEPVDAKADAADAKAEAADAKADTKAAIEPPADAKTPTDAKTAPPADDAKSEPAAKDGCFASARPRSLVGSGIALAIAVLAGAMLRRRG